MLPPSLKDRGVGMIWWCEVGWWGGLRTYILRGAYRDDVLLKVHPRTPEIAFPSSLFLLIFTSSHRMRTTLTNTTWYQNSGLEYVPYKVTLAECHMALGRYQSRIRTYSAWLCSKICALYYLWNDTCSQCDIHWKMLKKISENCFISSMLKSSSNQI